MSEFSPESWVQVLCGNPTSSCAIPEFAEALFDYILHEIARVYGNINQESWSIKYTSDPGIPGLEVRAYYWGADADEAAKPNFVFRDVEIRWYKYTGRGMSCIHDLSPEKWIEWFDACLQAIRDHEDASTDEYGRVRV